jgi:putative PIN family toxin of toxin-antitoxin system
LTRPACAAKVIRPQTRHSPGTQSEIDSNFDTVYDTNVGGPQIVIDTNVLVAALRSQHGAAYRLLRLVGSGQFEINLSVPLVLEYEEVAKRQADKIGLSLQAIDDIVDYLCLVANRQSIHYLWRPLLEDPKDDMVLELAVAGQCDFIVTYNQRHFRGTEQFGIRVATPKVILEKIGALS